MQMAASLTLIDTIMKSLLLICLIFLIHGNSYGDSTGVLKNKISRVLSPIEKMLKEDPSGETVKASFSKSKIANSIISYLYEVAGSLDDFSQAREERAKQVEQWLAPHDDALIAFLNAGQLSHPSYPSANMTLLQFAAPTEKLRDALLEVGRNPQGRAQYNAEAYDTILKLGLDTPQIMQDVIQKIAWRDNDPRHQSSEQARIGSILLAHAAKWGRPELMDMYQKFLSVPYLKGSYSNELEKMRLSSNYRIAFSSLKAFGKLDESLISLMKERLAEIELSGTDNDRIVIEIAYDSIGIAEGQIRPMPLTNLKGQFLGISKQTYPVWLAAHPAKLSAEKERLDRRSFPSKTSLPSDPNIPDASADRSLEKGIVVGRMLTFVGIIGTIIAVILIWRWKSKSTV
jgi:hypothetical protein